MGSEGTAAEVYQITRQLFGTAALTRIKTGSHKGSEAVSEPSLDEDVVNAVSRLEMQGYMANTLLRDTDVMSMAHSLEVRVPFVDVRVVDYVLGLPGEWKVSQDGVPKSLLADAVADLLPRDFLARRKMGFTLPFEKWMQGQMRAEIASVFDDDRGLEEAGLLPGGVRAVWRRFLNAPRAVGWSRPWSLFVLANWCRINRVSV